MDREIVKGEIMDVMDHRSYTSETIATTLSGYGSIGRGEHFVSFVRRCLDELVEEGTVEKRTSYYKAL